MVTNLRLLNPDFDYCFFDNDDVERFIDREFPQHRATFDAFPFPIQRYDFFRYLAVHRLGGFYFNLDVLLATNLSPLLPAGCVFPFEGLTFSHFLLARGMDWEIGNYAFGASAGHPFLEEVIENCVKAQRDPTWAREMMRGVPWLSRSDYLVLTTTGPGLLSRTLAQRGDLAQSVSVLFPEDVCDPRTWHVFGQFGVHLMEGTWRPSSGFIRRRLANRLEAWALERRLRRSRQLGATRTLAARVSLPSSDAASDGGAHQTGDELPSRARRNNP